MSFVIHTDSGCDISLALLKEWGVAVSGLLFRFDDDDREYSAFDMEPAVFYERMRQGSTAKTSAINSEMFREVFEKTLLEGKDVLYISFSSGLSTTYNSARMAAEDLRSQYPDRKVIVVDTLAASAGQGMLVKLAVDKKATGATIEETAAYVDKHITKLCHWFTVDDLMYLKRGGRVSPTVAFVGNALGIKPILHVDYEGHLVKVTKARSRKNSISMLADKYVELAETVGEGPVYISHGDCIADAEALAALIFERTGAKTEIITDVGPVIGAHSGPGTLALFFIGTER